MSCSSSFLGDRIFRKATCYILSSFSLTACATTRHIYSYNVVITSLLSKLLMIIICHYSLLNKVFYKLTKLKIDRSQSCMISYIRSQNGRYIFFFLLSLFIDMTIRSTKYKKNKKKMSNRTRSLRKYKRKTHHTV